MRDDPRPLALGPLDPLVGLDQPAGMDHRPVTGLRLGPLQPDPLGEVPEDGVPQGEVGSVHKRLVVGVRLLLRRPLRHGRPPAGEGRGSPRPGTTWAAPACPPRRRPSPAARTPARSPPARRAKPWRAGRTGARCGWRARGWRAAP